MPRIQMTRTVRIALWSLRVYLLILMLLIGLKFVRDFSAAPTSPPPAAEHRQTER